MIKLINILENIVKEAFTKKTILGKGAHKATYPSLYKDVATEGEFVIKTWYKYPKLEDKYRQNVIDNIVKKEYEIYLKNKQLMAPIAKINFDKRYMIQKKLNTEKAKNEVDKLDIYIKPYYKDLPIDEEYHDPLEAFEALLEKPDILNTIKNNIKEPELVNIYDKWIEFTKKIGEMDTTNSMGNKKPIDFHLGNVGYDSDDNLKLLDI